MLATDSLYVLIFVSGLLGGFGHCIGMCGPVVASYSLHVKRKSYAPHLLYNLGRVTTYSLLGGITGLTGSFVGSVKFFERFQYITLATVGVAMVLMGLASAGWLTFLKPGGQESREKKGRGPGLSFTLFLNRIVTFIAGTRTAGAYFPMGLVLGFIPCGILYTALIAAAGAGVEAGTQVSGFLHGMLLLFLFGLGTSPALFLLGKVVSMKGEWLRKRLSRASALVMVVVGIVFVYRAFRS